MHVYQFSHTLSYALFLFFMRRIFFFVLHPFLRLTQHFPDSYLQKPI